jgi:hypothetical protein
MTNRIAVMWFLTLVTTACTAWGSAPTSPAPVQHLPFRAGGYVLCLSGDSIECNDLSLPEAGTSLAVHVTLTAYSGAWVERPTIPGSGATVRS